VDLAELEDFLVREEEDLEWSDQKDGFYIRSKRWGTCIKLDLNKLESLDEVALIKELVQGKNIEQITRVTGFFSKTRQWNPGKRGELKERFKTGELTFTQS
jgi:hypothetical protein